MKGKTGIKNRRKSALSMLNAQLLKGKKPAKVSGKTSLTELVALSDTDIKRIKKEIEVLTTKIEKS